MVPPQRAVGVADPRSPVSISVSGTSRFDRLSKPGCCRYGMSAGDKPARQRDGGRLTETEQTPAAV